MSNNSITIEDLTEKFSAAAVYLIEIFIINRDYGVVKNSVIASRLCVSKPAVTQAMNRLKKYSLIEQDLYGSICLTSSGRIIASRLLKRHYLLEHLLISKLDYDWVKSDIEASKLQSSISNDFEDFLYNKLGKPQTCPHGNPFPGSKMENDIVRSPRLSSVGIGQKLKVVRITEEGEAADGLLQFCYENSLKPGCEIMVEFIEKSSVIIRLEEGELLEIPNSIARYIGCIDVK